MYNFSYSVRILKEEIQEFLDGICEGIPRPDAKLVFDLVYGILRSGSTKVSMISRALGEARRLDSTEHRLTRAIESRDVSAVRDALAAYSVDVSDSFLALDESDIQKPYGKAFEWLDDVQDGSEDGRPVGKGYHVIGLAAIGSRKAVFPIALHVYSAKADGFESQQKETEKVLPDAEGRTLSMDRGYDGTIWMGVAGKAKMDWTIRAKSNRKYGVLSMKSGKKTIKEIQKAVKGRYAFHFRDPERKEDVLVKATALRVSHPDLPEGTWLVIEYFPGEAEARCYLTSLDCSTKEGCQKALKCYRQRWRIEEFFRFAKVIYGMEGFMVRNINAVNWIMTAVCIAAAFLSTMSASKSKAWHECREAYRSFGRHMPDAEIIQARGHIPIELCHLAYGVMELLGHSSGKMKPSGRDRTGRPKYVQTRLF